jgi:ribosomal protein S18 acetylase RimI-like enzyme
MPVETSTQADLATLGKVLDQTELFPSEMLPDMIRGFLDGSDTDAVWLTHQGPDGADGFCFATPEQMTDGTWNMLAIAVHPDAQGQGAGRAITGALESNLRQRGARILIADTSGTDDFAATRAFYAAAGYTQESRIRDFWAAGDDKITFRKALGDG